MVIVVQLVEQSVVIRYVVGSNPISHPKYFSINNDTIGCVTQLAEYSVLTREVGGSMPSASTKLGSLVNCLLSFQDRGRRFESGSVL